MTDTARSVRDFWLKTAERIDSGDWGRAGLCYETYRLPIGPWRAALRQVEQHMEVYEDAFVFAPGARYVERPGEPELRVWLALMMAWEAETDGV